MNDKTASRFEDRHARLIKLFNNYKDTKKVNLAKAKEIFNDFSNCLERHMQWEEKVLFPILRKDKSTSHDNSIDLIRTEHIKLIAYLKDLYEKINKDLFSDKEEERLISNLIKHEELEDEIIHPTIIRLIKNKEAREDIFDSMDSI